MKRCVSVAAVSAVLGLAYAAPSGAATLDLNLTVDNQFAVYLSSSDSVLGTFVGSGDAWQTTYSFSDPLGAGRQYIHVIATNWTTDNGLWGSPGTPNGTGGNPDGFIGTFSISGQGYTFANGLTTLSTDTTDWRADPATPADPAPLGADGGSGLDGADRRASVLRGQRGRAVGQPRVDFVRRRMDLVESRQPQLRRIFDDHIVVGSRVIHMGHAALRLCGPRLRGLSCAQGRLDRRLRIPPTLGKDRCKAVFLCSHPRRSYAIFA